MHLDGHQGQQRRVCRVLHTHGPGRARQRRAQVLVGVGVGVRIGGDEDVGGVGVRTGVGEDVGGEASPLTPLSCTFDAHSHLR